MHISELIQRIEAAVPPGAVPGTRHCVEGTVDTGAQAHVVSIAMRIDPAGRRRETWLCDGIRVEPSLLKRLTCAQHDCPQAGHARRDWQNFQRRRLGLPVSLEPVGGRRAFNRDRRVDWQMVSLEGGALKLQARTSLFPGYLACPNQAHPPARRDLPGYDVFEGSEFVVGGGRQVLRDGRVEEMGPRLRSLEQVQALLDHSHRAAGQAIRQAAERSRS
jgi:hypothetical protein